MGVRGAGAWAAVVGIGALPILGGCGGHATIRSDATARFVVENVQKDTGFKPADVECPGGVEASPGVEFDCRFTGPRGPYLAHLKITKIENDEVTYEYGIQPIR